MELSKHNIIAPLRNSKDYFIVNLLSKQADIIDEVQYNSLINKSYTNVSELFQRGYLVDSKVEMQQYRDRYLKFVDDRDTDEIQLFYVPGYACNFSCSYCYQDEYSNDSHVFGNEKITSFFNFVESQFADRRKYITLFGGEPLLNSANQRKIIEKFVDETILRKLDLAIVTNGYHLSSYVDLLKKAFIREIQVTLDGVGAGHDSRRSLKNGAQTFNKIVEGIDQALSAGLPVNLRMVIDKENILELPRLASFAIEKGWTKNPLFKTQLGRNYELHHCQTEAGKLYNRLEMYEDIYDLAVLHPEILEFHKPAFSISKFLFEEGELPDPLFDSCPATKTEWAFDYSGKIYSCTATVGKKGEELGTFFPEVSLDEQVISEWESRDVLSIEKCKDCNLRLACGGGCGSVAKNENGAICTPDCRPVDKLMSLGISLYFN